MVIEKPIWDDYVELWPEEDDPDYDGVHAGGIKGIRNDAPPEVVEAFKEYLRVEASGVKQ